MKEPFDVRRVLVVLGARSGSSALAGTLGCVGCALPKTLMPANWANTKGYFEPQDIADLHDELLASAGSVWSDWREFSRSWYGTREAQQYRQSLSAAFRENYGDAKLSVLKEPRMCRILPFWDGIFEDVGVEPLFCFVDRNPMEVAASLQARDGSSVAQGLRYYLRNHLDAEYATRGRKRAFVTYGGLLANWRSTLGAIATTLGIRFPQLQERESEVDAFLDTQLRHQHGADIESPAGVLSNVAEEVHALFQELSNGASETPARRRLDELRAWFNAFGGAEAVETVGV